MNPEILYIGLGIVGAVGTLATLARAIYRVGPDEVAVIQNWRTAELRSVLNRNRRQWVRTPVISEETKPALLGRDGSVTPISENDLRLLQKNPGSRHARNIIRTWGTRDPSGKVSLNITEIPTGTGKIVIKEAEIPAPARGWRFRNPLNPVTIVPTGRFDVNFKENPANQPQIRDGNQPIFAQPDGSVSFAIRPDAAADFVRWFSQKDPEEPKPLEKLIRVVSDTANAAINRVTGGKDLETHLTGEKNIQRVTQEMAQSWAETLYRVGLHPIISPIGVTFAGVDPGEEYRDSKRETATQVNRIRAIGDPNSAIADIYSRGKNVTVVVPGGAKGETSAVIPPITISSKK